MGFKATREQYSPSLFDVAQDITGTLPVKLVERWLSSEQGPQDAQNLLEPFKVRGYSVSSDSSGLTKLSGQKSLIEILAILSQPKEIVYGYGAAIGGQGVGIWAADNTQMFYPPAVSAETLLSALLTIQDEINERCQIKIGLGAHYGEFYSISGGLYGTEADAIEEIAENDTAGGEIVITQAFLDLLPPTHAFTAVKREDEPMVVGSLYRIVDGPRLSGVVPTKERYPIPYSEQFYGELITYDAALHDAAFGARILQRYTQSKVVVLIERESKPDESYEVDLLGNMALSAFMKDVGMRHLSQHNGTEIKVVGPLGIYVFDTGTAALAFAREFGADLTRQDVSCRIGIDAGTLMIFDLATGGRDIAGQPVNIASKMAQDKGTPGHIYLSHAMKDLVDVSGFKEIKLSVSGVEMIAFEQGVNSSR
ncbi:family 3 adenylate cyclase [Polyangium fumosum]|uniref:Family 3 adenylate cyclase n=1 Tax=Polyangium fumosum TaxID=889272 RepID=A0A4U1IQ76_9BACT|nr:family 3 adenylate cyclase [Polyangium fumosum]TKC96366.1 family 3 adenylate cyclase [Polyangium fumosum]